MGLPPNPWPYVHLKATQEKHGFLLSSLTNLEVWGGGFFPLV